MKYRLLLVAVALMPLAWGCRTAEPPLVFWDAVPESLLKAKTIFFDSPNHSNYLGKAVARKLENELHSCVPGVQTVPSEADADAVIEIAEYPEMLGFDMTLSRIEGAYLQVRFKSGAEGILYRRAPSGCDVPCAFELIARDFAREWCRLKRERQ